MTGRHEMTITVHSERPALKQQTLTAEQDTQQIKSIAMAEHNTWQFIVADQPTMTD